MSVTFEPAVQGYCDALLAYSTKLAEALVRVQDPSRPAVGHWNIAETATHVSHSSPYFLAAARGEAELENLDENAAATTSSRRRSRTQPARAGRTHPRRRARPRRLRAPV